MANFLGHLRVKQCSWWGGEGTGKREGGCRARDGSARVTLYLLG